MIPAIEDSDWYLAEGLHLATVGELHQRFVVDAPFRERRQEIFDAFSIWRGQLLRLVPEARLWVDGGFVTLKSWAAPSDIDVAVRVKAAEVNAIPPSERPQFADLFTKQHGPGSGRVQPMAGLVDAFVSLRDKPERTLYWRETWATVLDTDRNVVDGAAKGFLEVRP